MKHRQERFDDRNGHFPVSRLRMAVLLTCVFHVSRFQIGITSHQTFVDPVVLFLKFRQFADDSRSLAKLFEFQPQGHQLVDRVELLLNTFQYVARVTAIVRRQ